MFKRMWCPQVAGKEGKDKKVFDVHTRTCLFANHLQQSAVGRAFSAVLIPDGNQK